MSTSASFSFPISRAGAGASSRSGGTFRFLSLVCELLLRKTKIEWDVILCDHSRESITWISNREFVVKKISETIRRIGYRHLGVAIKTTYATGRPAFPLGAGKFRVSNGMVTVLLLVASCITEQTLLPSPSLESVFFVVFLVLEVGFLGMLTLILLDLRGTVLNESRWRPRDRYCSGCYCCVPVYQSSSCCCNWACCYYSYCYCSCCCWRLMLLLFLFRFVVCAVIVLFILEVVVVLLSVWFCHGVADFLAVEKRRGFFGCRKASENNPRLLLLSYT